MTKHTAMASKFSPVETNIAENIKMTIVMAMVSILGPIKIRYSPFNNVNLVLSVVLLTVVSIFLFCSMKVFGMKAGKLELALITMSTKVFLKALGLPV